MRYLSHVTSEHPRKLAMFKKIIFLFCLAQLSVTAQAGLFSPDLDEIHDKIVEDYEQVEHLEASQLMEMDQENFVFFDVREQKEFDVSHLDGAIQVDPDISPEEFVERYAEQIDGKTLVFYCSVGRRSSKLLSEVSEVIDENNVNASYNLVGGVFRWSNDERPLVNLAQPTEKVHPYNLYWGQLIEDKEAISYKPEDAP